MDLTLVGLGRMGGNMARRLGRGGHSVTAVDPNPEARGALAEEPGVGTLASLAEAVAAHDAPRVVWLMLPAGDVTEAVIREASELLSPGDLVVDGGNADYRDSQRMAASLSDRGLGFVDVGVSGGVWGLREGYGLMVGGSMGDVERLTPALKTLAPTADSGWVHAGPVGAGHFAKMVHNGIEYGAHAGPSRRIRPAAGSRRPRHRRRGGGRGVAARNRHPIVAARPHGVGLD